MNNARYCIVCQKIKLRRLGDTCSYCQAKSCVKYVNYVCPGKRSAEDEKEIRRRVEVYRQWADLGMDLRQERNQ